LAQAPAKLMKKFRRNFERNSNSDGMQELASTELRQNGFRGICRVPNDVQIERRQTPTLDLGVINKQTNTLTTTTTIDDAHPPSPSRHRHLIATATSSSPSTSGHVYPHPFPTTSRPRTMWQCHVMYRTSAGHVATSPPPHHISSTTPTATMTMQHVNGPLRTCCVV
jgi:hypothetical protein